MEPLKKGLRQVDFVRRPSCSALALELNAWQFAFQKFVGYFYVATPPLQGLECVSNPFRVVEQGFPSLFVPYNHKLHVFYILSWLE